MPKLTMKADTSAARTFLATLTSISVLIDNQNHNHVATRAAFEILADRFKDATSAAAVAAPQQFHHVYEPQQIGVPQSALFQPVMKGRTNQNRTVSWEWRASKQLVDPEFDDLGNPRFKGAQVDGFNPGKLNKIHVFVWKAPIMEYGLSVTVRPELSDVLVLPNPEFKNVRDTDARAVRPVVFTPFSYTFRPGAQTAGNFTSWFLSWWGGGSAETVIDQEFNSVRDKSFNTAFVRRTAQLSRPVTGVINATISTRSAAEGKRIAGLIRGDMERQYIRMAAQRKRRNI